MLFSQNVFVLFNFFNFLVCFFFNCGLFVKICLVFVFFILSFCSLLFIFIIIILAC